MNKARTSCIGREEKQKLKLIRREQKRKEDGKFQWVYKKDIMRWRNSEIGCAWRDRRMEIMTLNEWLREIKFNANENE